MSEVSEKNQMGVKTTEVKEKSQIMGKTTRTERGGNKPLCELKFVRLGWDVTNHYNCKKKQDLNRSE